MARSRTSTTHRLHEAIRYHGFGIAAALLFLAPLAWSVLVSFKPSIEARQPPLPPWPVGGFSVQSYENLAQYGAGIWTYTGNSLIVSAATVVASVVISLFAGYGFSRFQFPLKNALFVLIISTVMIPFQSILTPLFLILTKLGLQNTLTGIVLVYVTLQLPFSIFMMRNAFDAVPKEIEDAARVDGASVFAVLYRIMLPLVLPGVATVAIFAFLASWNEFLAALILLTDQNKYTLPVLMAAVRSGQFGTIDWGAVQSGVTLMMAPCLVIFLALQRYYIRGLTAGAVK
ncbi:carbohydrate ABC transporter permease [Phyllobacterium endophyticum]|uniref:sn-glycerol-3-phosphate transport system permease protein UgpE n=1 Tax=Phyllobacterium endophyticum TaxID=1149773 RepID=A0A2P7ASA5_9HYPH|nr:carbohydrate ABC transporter permease [Phyllobacterium endophyticum]MBB3236771.1 multiple sugar transport system permease protein [Phyllobacterium endophyticum]PSH57047.1 carbohydrate ABC transporter permease [Phyllobacterium endophyticum]TYR40326.1 carbohydrate ABC transporter permease [Phyllobacterium endophyticum]